MVQYRQISIAVIFPDDLNGSDKLVAISAGDCASKFTKCGTIK